MTYSMIVSSILLVLIDAVYLSMIGKSAFEKTVSATLSGKVLKTTIDKWGLFYEEIKRHNFKSFSVAKEGEDLFVFFL